MVTVGVGAQGIQPGGDLGSVGETVAIRIGIQGVGTAADLGAVAQPVVIGVADQRFVPRASSPSSRSPSPSVSALFGFVPIEIS
jgi:hypothetical protein